MTYNDVETKAATELRRSFGLPPATSAPVELADVYMLLIEAKDLLPSGGSYWFEEREATGNLREMALSATEHQPYLRPQCWPPARGAEEFMHRFNIVSGWDRATA